MKIIKAIKNLIGKVFYGVLGFFGLIDDKRQLSRTTALLYLFAYKFASVPLAVSNITELVGAVVALGGVGGAMGLYAWKKKVESGAAAVGADLIATIKNKVSESDTEE